MDQKEKYSAIGCMSGTSLDGLDLVLVEFLKSGSAWSFKIHKSRFFDYPVELLKKVLNVSGKKPSGPLIDLDRDIALWIGDSISEFLEDSSERIDLIASHGQTIYHNPSEKRTIQLGNGQVIANRTGIPVINDFRIQDLELGGQGAPLVPIGDKHLFPNYKYCLNLGGIANVSIKDKSGIRAFDVCICNVALNYFAQKVGLTFDMNGDEGRKGKVLPDVLISWNELPYFREIAPKSMDAGFFKKEMLPLLNKHDAYVNQDLLATTYEHIAYQVHKAIEDRNEEILVTGGGAKNAFLTHIMQDKYGLNLYIPQLEIVDFKEALIFAFLGVLKMRKENNVLSSVTGSQKDHSAGFVHYPED